MYWKTSHKFIKSIINDVIQISSNTCTIIITFWKSHWNLRCQCAKLIRFTILPWMHVPRNVAINTTWASLQNTILTCSASRLAICISLGHRQKTTFLKHNWSFVFFVNELQKLGFFCTESGNLFFITFYNFSQTI